MSRDRQDMRNRDLGWWQDLRLAIRLYRDPRVSSVIKALVPLLAALYVLSPIDLVPDFIVGFGQVDDVGVLGLLALAAVALIRRLAPRSVVEEHLTEMGLWDDSETRAGAQETTGDPERIIEAAFSVDSRSTTQSSRRVM
jgi:uncharacterized membrane protein YkvA (DUF1232 family)